MAGGFDPLFRFVSNDGAITEHSFLRHGAKFEFFALERRDARLRYFLYSVADGPEAGRVQATAEIADQPLESFRFLRRRWRKHADHEAELTEIYGDWRTPDPAWSYMDDRAIVDRRAWEGPSHEWSGDLPRDSGR